MSSSPRIGILRESPSQHEYPLPTLDEVEEGSVPFPAMLEVDDNNLTRVGTASTALTESDKVTDLPNASPGFHRLQRHSEPSLHEGPNASSNMVGRVGGSDPSLGQGARVSFESDRERSLPSLATAAARLKAGNEPPPAQSPARSSPTASRNQSPFRKFWPLHRIHSREEPFIPLDPYRFALNLPLCDHFPEYQHAAHAFLVEVVRQSYRHALLRLPSVYFTRVSRLFEDADVSKPEIQRMIEGCARGMDFPRDWTPPNVSPALARFKESWEEFIDSALREWKTMNLVSTLLLTGLLTILEILSQEAVPPPVVVRTTALLALVSAIASLCFGSVYFLRFGTMRTMYKATRWAEEARRSRTNIFWNVWVLLAIPAVWLSWSIIWFCVCILAFVWTTGTTPNPSSAEATSSSENPPLHDTSPSILGPRIVISIVFGIAAVYFGLVVKTFRSYSGRRPHRPASEAALVSVMEAGSARASPILAEQKWERGAGLEVEDGRGRTMSRAVDGHARMYS